MTTGTPSPSLSELYPNLNMNYKHLTPEEVSHFLEHGWVIFRNAMNPSYVDRWMSDLFTRMDMDPDDKSTWDVEYQHLPRHREVPAREFCPEAWEKIVEMCGGGIEVERDRIDEERETWYGDAFIVNMGTEEKTLPGYKEPHPSQKEGWHIDDDWYRLLLDASGTALTLLHCYSDIPEGGGGTWLCEDGMTHVHQYLLDHPEGLDPPFPFMETVCGDITQRRKFAQVVARKGDIVVSHGRLPHTVADNLLHYPRVITNPHIALHEPYNLNRPDGNYSLVEQAILNSLGRTSIPEFKPTREREFWYPRNQGTKRNKADGEVQRMEAAALAKGLPKESVNSFYQSKGTQEWKDFEHRNGFDKEIPPSGLRAETENKRNGLNHWKEKTYSPPIPTAVATK